jgi:hypothetical protein
VRGCRVDFDGRPEADAGEVLAEAVADDDATPPEVEDFVGLATKVGSNPQDQSVSAD